MYFHSLIQNKTPLGIKSIHSNYFIDIVTYSHKYKYSDHTYDHTVT